ncbi:MAG: 4Fe-4S binding protein [Chloroflexi bacterium]|nr:4Fe-4S binding protein [Chloroflexota bacterium]MDA8188778.1 4Fe-4S binding protein [Dehalococcoidales bacterium]
MRQIVIDPNKCDPAACTNGICVVKKACPVKALYQPEPYEVPITDWNRCRSCGKCIAECPMKAVRLGE